jgi:hypothetical protein
MYCSSCGQQSESISKFCQRCGTSLQGATPPASGTPWVLLIFLGILFIRPLILVIQLQILGDLPRQVSNDGRVVYGLEMLANGVLAVWGSVVAVQTFKKQPHCLAILRRFLKVNFWFLALDLFAAVGFLGAEIGIASLIRSLAFLLPCYLYFKASKTVCGVYGTNL